MQAFILQDLLVSCARTDLLQILFSRAGQSTEFALGLVMSVSTRQGHSVKSVQMKSPQIQFLIQTLVQMVIIRIPQITVMHAAGLASLAFTPSGGAVQGATDRYQ